MGILCDNKTVESVEIPDSVKSIHEGAFSYNKALKSIKVGKNVNEIGDGYGFYESVSSKLERIEVSPKNKTYYSIDGVLYRKESGEKILLEYPKGKKDKIFSIPEDTTSVMFSAFHGEYLSTLKIPASVKKVLECNERLMDGEWVDTGEEPVGLQSWAGCTEIIVDEKNENYYSKDGVLFNRENVLLTYPTKKADRKYEVPDGTKEIQINAFKDNRYMEEIIIPDSVRWIAGWAFREAVNLKSVDTSSSIGDEAFFLCEKLSHINLREGVGYIGEWAFGGTVLEHVVLPESLEELDREALSSRNLKTIEIRSKECQIQGIQGFVNKTVIYGYENSTAEKFAKEHGYQFKLIGSEETPGEDNSKGTITKNTIKLSKTSYTYDGKEKKPQVIVKDKFGNKIPPNCYKVSYKNNKKVGIATVKIQLTWDYTGTIKTNFTIKPPKSAIVKTTSLEKGILLHWKGVKPSQINGYEIQYSENKKFDAENTKKVIVNRKDAAKKKIGNLNAKQTYYVRIRSYKAVAKDGKTERIYSKWSDVKKVKTL